MSKKKLKFSNKSKRESMRSDLRERRIAQSYLRVPRSVAVTHALPSLSKTHWQIIWGRILPHSSMQWRTRRLGSSTSTEAAIWQLSDCFPESSEGSTPDQTPRPSGRLALRNLQVASKIRHSCDSATDQNFIAPTSSYQLIFLRAGYWRECDNAENFTRHLSLS